MIVTWLISMISRFVSSALALAFFGRPSVDKSKQTTIGAESIAYRNTSCGAPPPHRSQTRLSSLLERGPPCPTGTPSHCATHDAVLPTRHPGRAAGHCPSPNSQNKLRTLPTE